MGVDGLGSQGSGWRLFLFGEGGGGQGKKLLKGGFSGLTHHSLPPSAVISIPNLPSSFSSPFHLIRFSEGVSRVFPKYCPFTHGFQHFFTNHSTLIHFSTPLPNIHSNSHTTALHSFPLISILLFQSSLTIPLPKPPLLEVFYPL